MEDMILKVGEFGALGAISLYLLTRGMSSIKELADSNKMLADAVTKLSDKVNGIDLHVGALEAVTRDINRRLDKIEDTLIKLEHQQGSKLTK